MALSAWLQDRFGYYVLPTYDYSGLDSNKAPKLYGQDSQLIIPDLLAFNSSRTIWVECKWKTSADLHRKTGHLVTGINRRLYNHYQQVRSVTGFEIYIAFIHAKEAEIRGGELADLARKVHHAYDGDKMGRGGMVFWDYNQLKLWGALRSLKVA